MTFLLSFLDVFLGWLLALPRDLAIVLLALGTSFGMTLVRRWVTDQDLLHRAAADLRRLKERIRAAKREGDRDAVRRMQSTMASVRLLRLPAEGQVLLVAFLPLALVGWWGLERLEYYGVAPGESFHLTANYRVSASGKLTHLVPPEGPLALESAAIQIVPESEADALTWTLKANAPFEGDLIVRCAGRSVTHRVRVGTRTTLAAEQSYESGPIARTMVSYAAYRSPLSRLLPAGWLPAPEWVWWYLLLTLLLVPISRRILGAA
ncbi:MAG: hypothetical protein IT428_22720 [Planctomycetaceae bacterium]|nr:hypothetical protein [Planctomycetaceae bacterium]